MASVQLVHDDSSTSVSSHSFNTIYSHLATKYSFPVLPSPSPRPRENSLSHNIASLSLHPTLEAILHILNNDLPSAHFLCRHMQNAPAYEGMFIHGLLHRVEGDYRNAEAWYGDVAGSQVFQHVWPKGLADAKAFIVQVEKLKKTGDGDAMALAKESGREFDALVNWCERQFGTGRVDDATIAWVAPSEEHRKMAARMIVGGEGWRKF